MQEVPLDDEEPAASDNGSDAEQPEDDTTVAPVPGAAEEETAEEAAPEPAAGNLHSTAWVLALHVGRSPRFSLSHFFSLFLLEPEEAKPAKEAKGDVFGGGDDDDLFGGEPEEASGTRVEETNPRLVETVLHLVLHWRVHVKLSAIY